MKNLMSIAGVALLALVVSSSAFAGTIALWDYNNVTLNSTLSPNIGTGSMAGRGLSMDTATIKWDTDLGDPGTTEGNSSDPDIIANPLAHATKGRAEWNGKLGGGDWVKADAPGSQAVIWKTSTVGYSNIVVSLDVKVKDYDPRYFQLQYSTNGVDFTTYSQIYDAGHPEQNAPWFNNNVMDLSNVSAANNCESFAFAFIMAYGPGETSYVPAFAWDGTKKPGYAFDMVTVSSVPEPGGLIALASGLVGLLGFVRKRTS